MPNIPVFFVLSCKTLLFSACGETTQKQPHDTSKNIRQIAVDKDWTWYVTSHIVHTDTQLSLDIDFKQGLPKKVKHLQYFLNTDNNPDTGFSIGEDDWKIAGADYMIEDGDLYKSQSQNSWEWTYVGTFSEYTQTEKNVKTHIHIASSDKKILSIITQDTIPLTIEPFWGDWESNFHTISTQNVLVKKVNIPREIIFDDAEDGISDAWVTVKGHYYAEQGTPGYKGESNAHIHLYNRWQKDAQGKWYNDVEYHLPLKDNTHTTLSVDIVGTGEEVEHYDIGVSITTAQGKRFLLWDSFYTHENLPEKRTQCDNGNIFMIFPSPIELVRGYDFSDPYLNENFTVDLEASLQHFEPNNTILTVDTFIATGGNLDNITLIR